MKTMKRIAILMMLSVAAWAQDSAQQTPPATTSKSATAKPATTKSATTAKKATTSAQKTGTGSTSTAKKPGTAAAKSGAAQSGTTKTAGATKSGANKSGTKAGATKAGATSEGTKAKPLVAGTPEAAANPEAIFETSMGKMKCELFPRQAPKTVANFIGLAQGTKEWTDPKTGQKTKKPLFDNTIFHRVIPNFMIQGGDPIGNGTGDPGYRFEDEFSPDLRFDRPGRLAMANSGPGTNGSQFFITEVPTPHLNDHHTIFGQCDAASVELVKKIARKPADPRDNRPYDPVKVTSITITGMDGAKPATKPPVKFLGPPVKKPGTK